MPRPSVITKDKFDKMLAWLDADREGAGKKYEDVRRSLIKILTWRGCSDAEDLADEVINRVVQKIDELAAVYTGDPALYFYGVAKKLLLEHRRQELLRMPLPEIVVHDSSFLRDGAQEEEDDFEREYECLTRCMQELKPADRELILAYYCGEKQAKINNRKGLARQEGLAANTLRVRVYRIRAALEKCTLLCLKRGA